MQVRVLGCSGAIAQGCRTTSFLLNQHILIDAGTGVGDLPVEEMLRIDHVLLSAPLAAVCSAAGIDRAPRKLERPSDHAPVWAEIGQPA